MHGGLPNSLRGLVRLPSRFRVCIRDDSILLSYCSTALSYRRHSLQRGPLATHACRTVRGVVFPPIRPCKLVGCSTPYTHHALLVSRVPKPSSQQLLGCMRERYFLSALQPCSSCNHVLASKPSSFGLPHYKHHPCLRNAPL